VPPRERMMLNLYLGMARQADSLYAPAIVALFDAADAAQTIPDNLSLGIIYRTIAEIYSEVYNDMEALHYSKMSLSNFVRSRRQPHIRYARLDLAISYNNALLRDSCLTEADSVITEARETADTALLIEALKIKTFAHIANGNCPKALTVYGN
ncbi:MAG: hypothetical protein K2M97_01565, partial [Muribaculaceae bacterium]|nr:hypothetical protein [Muribaculaceae bacterium]